MDAAQASELPIPGRLNLALLGLSAAAAAFLLWTASHAAQWWIALAAALAFSYVNNTIFSLMHEAVHRHFHPSAGVNEWCGRVAAAFFPTAFALQRVFHEAHHRNNRSDLERFDYYAPHENRTLKTAQWYAILTGIYWAGSPLFCLLYLPTAGLVDWPKLFAPGNRFARQTSAEPFLDSLRRIDPAAARRDILLSIAVQCALVLALGLTWQGWLLCYACFAVNWSSLQYADHAFSPLDGTEGAWNLRFNPLARAMFLNYHLHLNHHRSPMTPWVHLPKLTRAEDPQQSFWRVYLRMWRGPRRLPAARGS